MNSWGHELERARRRERRRLAVYRIVAWFAAIALSLAAWLGAWYLTAVLFGLLGVGS